MALTSLAGLLVATLGGAAIGLERQWSGHASGPHARLGGIRTFTMLGGLAGLAGWLALGELRFLAVALLGGAAALVVIGYATAARTDIDATTEVAALVVLAAGTLAGAGQLALASAVIAATALLLLEKTRLHALVETDRRHRAPDQRPIRRHGAASSCRCCRRDHTVRTARSARASSGRWSCSFPA